ncbi:LysR substrate-binding domain-containing protein [Amycolatopsis minnesotensis]|uniref:LysR substrate-binding domain-containing protein n=1 Tax=Amycolatopsis minnesotensis TaxID=337894 RepID=UPI003CD0681F
MAGFRAEQATTIRVGTTSGLGPRLDLVLAGFAKLAPEVHVELMRPPTAERLKLARSGELDATLVRGSWPSDRLHFEATVDRRARHRTPRRASVGTAAKDPAVRSGRTAAAPAAPGDQPAVARPGAVLLWRSAASSRPNRRRAPTWCSPQTSTASTCASCSTACQQAVEQEAIRQKAARPAGS